MQNKTGNMQFQPIIPLKAKYCPLELPADFPILCMHGDLWYSHNYSITMVHFHNCLQIGYCYKGRGYFLIDSSLHPYEEECVSVIPPKITHHCTSRPNKLSRWKWLYLDPIALLPNLKPSFVKIAMSALYNDRGSIPYIISKRSESEVIAITRSIVYAMEEQRTGYREVVRCLAHALMLMWLRMKEEPNALELTTSVESNFDIISPAVQHISANYMNPIAIPELAELCHISPTHLRRIFSQVMECSPLEFLQLIRLEAACALLLRTNISIVDVGIRTGFPTETSFLRQFKKSFGTTPGRWRRELRSVPKSLEN